MATVYTLPAREILPYEVDRVLLTSRHSQEFHGVPVLMWKTGWCTELRCNSKATHVVHFMTGDSLPYCTIHSVALVKRAAMDDPDYGRILGALPINPTKHKMFGAVPHPPQIVYPMTETPRLETPEEWRNRLAKEGIPIPDPGTWEISERGIY